MTESNTTQELGPAPNDTKSVWPSSMLPIPLNRQPAEQPAHDKRSRVEVFDIFKTIQGEGPWSGFPCIFLRLSGCNLQCPHCDTDYTSKRTLLDPPQVIDRCQAIMKGGLIVITGGEPFRQNIAPLVKMMINTGFGVQVETNGCYYQEGFPYKKAMIVCSPKTPKIHPDLQPDYYKYIIDAEHVSEEDGLPTSVLGMAVSPARPHNQEVPVYIQPMDAKDEKKSTANLEATINSCFAYGHRLSIQLHKIVGLP